MLFPGHCGCDPLLIADKILALPQAAQSLTLFAIGISGHGIVAD